MHVLDRNAVRAEALFLSAVQPSEGPDAVHVRHAVAEVVRRLGRRECAARVAQEYGDHPDAAACRMRWARTAVADAFRAARSRWAAETLVVLDTAMGEIVPWPSAFPAPAGPVARLADRNRLAGPDQPWRG